MSLKIQFFQAGYCTHPEAIVIQGGRWKSAIFPSLFALIEHPYLGAILFDTGYSERFFTETRSFPFKLYAMITPVYFQEEESATRQLQQQKINPEAVKYIIISHFHADHIGGLRDFPNAQFICFKSAYQAVKDQRGFAATKAGFLPGMMPPDFEPRAIFLEDKPIGVLPPEYAPFDVGFDIFGDGTILAVELPGHVTGQLGIFLTDRNNQIYFLIADACWINRAYQELIAPHGIANLIFANRKEYASTRQKIHQLYKLNPAIKIIPTHCLTTWENLKVKTYE
jgi:glyoxylase-like metal-dependent hydrolase (beta-lactamase superfamily II)